MDAALVDLATAQGGVITTSQAKRMGQTPESLGALVRDHSLMRLTRGVYATSSPDAEALTTVGRHELLGRGAQLLYPDAALAGHTALVAAGLPVWGASLRRAQLERPIRREVITRDLVIRPPFGRQGVAESVVPTPVALVQHCLEHGAAAGVVAADAALHEGLTSLTELEEASRVAHGWPRSSRVRTMVAYVDARSESVGESRLRLALAFAGIDVVPQVVIRDEGGRIVARVDFLVKGTKVVIEFDGMVKYRDGGPEALVAEKRREDELRRLGYQVIRVVWADLERMAPVLARLRTLGVTSTAYRPSGVEEPRPSATAPEKGRLHPATVPG